MNKAAAAKKIQNIFRRKRVFPNKPIGGTTIRVSKPKITAQIVSFKTSVNLDSIFDQAPKGFTEVSGFAKTFKKADVRYVTGTGWVGEAEGITKVAAKKGKQTVMLAKDTVEVLGAGNYEAALLGVVRNGWAPKTLLNAAPNFKKIDGQFNVNKDFSLEDLVSELKTLPAALAASVSPFEPSIFPAVVLKLKGLGWTYQFFKNGTVLFSGVKNPKDIDLPVELFKNFFTQFGISTFVFGAGAQRIRLPNKGGANKSVKLAERYNLAGTWNALAKPPRGYYIRPGTNGKPRFYPWLRVEKKAYNVGEGMPHVNVKYYQMNLKAVAPKVVKAFRNAQKPIPKSTINAFAEAGFPLPLNANNENAKEGAKLGERRAPSWNATKPGFYVRPGPGQQPYWFKIPKGLASGRKTVVATYAKAGRNIPQAVRNIFKIGNNVKTGGETREHKVAMGLNQILRINNRQATRLTKKELLAIARNMNIPQVSDKMKPANIIGWIQNKAGVGAAPNRTYDVLSNGMFYKFLNNGRVERTTNKGIRTARTWATIPVAEQNKIALALLPANLRGEWSTVAKANRFNTLRAMAAAQKPASLPNAPRRATPPEPSPSSAGSVNNNFGKELEVTLKLQANLGNNYKEGNETAFMKIYGKLPVGKRGKPLKANENRAYKKFVKETQFTRVEIAPRARFMSRIQVPNWMPANKVQAYKNLVVNLAFQKPKPSQKNLKAAVKNWIARTVPLSPPRAAKVVENMITGEVKHIPAYVPKPRASPNIPKRTPPPKKSPKAKAPKNNRNKKEYALPANRTGIQNLNNALTNLGLPTGPKNTYTWVGLARVGLDPKFRQTWLNKVARN